MGEIIAALITGAAGLAAAGMQSHSAREAAQASFGNTKDMANLNAQLSRTNAKYTAGLNYETNMDYARNYPLAQVEGMKAAGINPLLGYSSGNTPQSNVSASSGGFGGAIGQYDYGNIGQTAANVIDKLAGVMTKKEQRENLKEQNENLKAQNDLIHAQTAKVEQETNESAERAENLKTQNDLATAKGIASGMFGDVYSTSKQFGKDLFGGLGDIFQGLLGTRGNEVTGLDAATNTGRKVNGLLEDVKKTVESGKPIPRYAPKTTLPKSRFLSNGR